MDHTTGNQDDVISKATAADHIADLVNIIESLDSQLSDEKERVSNLEDDLRGARAEIAQLERDLSAAIQ